MSSGGGAAAAEAADKKEMAKPTSSDAIQAAVRAGNINIHREDREFHLFLPSSL